MGIYCKLSSFALWYVILDPLSSLFSLVMSFACINFTLWSASSAGRDNASAT